MPSLLDKYEIREDGCWQWTGALRSGYGRVDFKGRKQSAHRVIYELVNDPIPDDMELDHLCRNRACVNPDHLEVVTHRENVRRGEAGKQQRERTHCPEGHPFSGDNLYVYAKTGKRECKECNRRRRREAYRAKARA